MPSTVPRPHATVRPIAAVIVVLAATLAGSAAAEAAPAPSPNGSAPPSPSAPPTPSPKPESWAVKCRQAADKTRHCSLLQNLMVKRGNTTQRLLSVLVQREPKGNGLVLLLSLPHGLYLPAGVQYAVDRGQAKTIIIQTTDANGAYAGTKLTPELLLELKRGRTLTIRMVAANRKALTTPVALTGFTAAYEKFVATGR